MQKEFSNTNRTRKNKRERSGFQLKVTDVKKKSEKLNSSLSVNVFALENKSVYFVHLTINRDAASHVKLLVITSGSK